jgi:uncharacterized protein
MKFVWDERKRLANLDKHGLDFEDIVLFDWDHALVEPSRPDHEGKLRFKAIGYFRDGTAVTIFALLGSEAISVISFRPAGPRERKQFYEQN